MFIVPLNSMTCNSTGLKFNYKVVSVRLENLKVQQKISDYTQLLV